MTAYSKGKAPAVSEAMREAVARDLEHLDRKNGGEDFSVYLMEAAFLTRYNGPIASEIARLTGEREAAIANAREPIGDTWDEIRRLEGECRICIRERDEWKTVANRDLARAEAAEAETARLRAELADVEGKCELARSIYATEKTATPSRAAEAFTIVRNVARAALTSQEQADV